MRTPVKITAVVLIALAVGFAGGAVWKHRQLSYELRMENLKITIK